jgi:amino acid permease
MTRLSQDRSRGQLGLLATGALVVGGIIGTGIIAVPAAVAKFGWMAYAAFAVVTGGSVMLAAAFGVRRSAFGVRRSAFGVRRSALWRSGALALWRSGAR